MAPFSLIIALCASVVVLTEANQTLLIQYNYPLADNFSYIELQCVDNSSQTAVLGASFQLNGTTIAENSQQSEIFFTLIQENEGFFICSLDGLSSTNTIGLAGEKHCIVLAQTTKAADGAEFTVIPQTVAIFFKKLGGLTARVAIQEVVWP